MIITNLVADPKATKRYPALNASATADGDHTTYTVVDNASNPNSAIMSTFPNVNGTIAYLVAIFAAHADKIIIESSSKVSASDTSAIFRYNGSGNTAIFLRNPLGSAALRPGDSVTLLALAAYTEPDWQALQKLGLDYFDGGTMPMV